MRLTFLQLALAGSTLAAKFPKPSVKDAAPIGFGNIVPNRFIVELESAADLQGPGRRSLDSRSSHAELYSHLRKRKLGFRVGKEFNTPGLFVGSVVTLEDDQDAVSVQNIPGVVAVRPVRIVQAPRPVKSHVVTGPSDPEVPPDTESTHKVTGVDKLHAQGIAGKGVKIAIIDTGIDHTHPTLGGGIGPGFKIIGGHDFVGDAYSSAGSIPVPDDDPLDQCNGHGTHVAGIIGADPNNMFNISGVAFEASINAYRIFGCTGGVTDDIIVAALLRGVQEGNDILTMSLGGPDGWTEGTASVVSSRIAASGKIVTIAAGNDGGKGSWYASAPGNGLNAISVASTDNLGVPLQNATVLGIQHDPITYFSFFPFPLNETLPIFPTSNDTTVPNDACNPLPDSTPDLSNFLPLIRRGNCTFVQKLTNVAAKGAKFALIYDNGSGFSDIDVGNFTATLIQSADGESLVKAVASGATVSISFPQSGASVLFQSPTANLVSEFTSYGPTNDFFFKPAIAAPGGNIVSTFPVPLGSFAVLSGTSMATPFVAGVSALLFGVKGNSADAGRGARSLFESTANFIPSNHTDDAPLQSATQQGAGLIDAFHAIHADIILSPTELITNDTAHFRGTQRLSVKNIGSKAKTFTVTHVPAGTAITLADGTIFPADGPVPLSKNFANVKFSDTRFTVGAGQTKVLTVTITPPAELAPSSLPVFSGFVQLTNAADAAETFHATYLGAAAALRDVAVLDNTDRFFGVPLPVLVNATTGDFLQEPTNFTFVGGDIPGILLRLAFGTPELRFDLVRPDVNITTTLNKRGLLGFPVPEARGGTFAAVPTLGLLFEQDFATRNSDIDDGTGFNMLTFPDPQFANATTIPNGSYRILVRALKVTGDATKEEDFESWLSPIIGVNAPPSTSA